MASALHIQFSHLGRDSIHVGGDMVDFGGRFQERSSIPEGAEHICTPLARLDVTIVYLGMFACLLIVRWNHSWNARSRRWSAQRPKTPPRYDPALGEKSQKDPAK